MRDTTSDILLEMLLEDTGKHMLDSGSLYGRHWQNNNETHKRSDIRERPRFAVDFSKGRIEAVHDVYHFLNEHLEYDKELDSSFHEFAEGENSSWLCIADEFIHHINGLDIFAVNTYNGEDFLSQTIQYTSFTVPTEYHKSTQPFVILQVHGGCDVRGGYSTPHIFRVIQQMNNSCAHITCNGKEGHAWYTDDTSHWYPEDNNDCRLENFDTIEIAFPNDWEKGKLCYTSDGTGYCPRCGAELSSSFW